MTEMEEWLKQDIRHRDVIDKRLVNIKKEKGDVLIAEYKDRKEFFVISKLLSEAETLVKGEDRVNLVVSNTKKNLDMLVKDWEKLRQYKNLKIIFANPDSRTDKKWVIVPHIHHKISEKKYLKNGLKALFDTVERV